MANLQYIGARYVPKFYLNPDYPAPDNRNNDWKSGVDYEALMIVTYNNDSYTSTKPVPDTVGNPASNPDYWACTTKYTAALMALQTTVQNLEDYVNPVLPLNTNADNVAGAINELVDDMPYLTPDMFYAAGDGITDDSNAFNDAVAACITKNKILVVPNKTYKVNAIIDMRTIKAVVSYGTIKGHVILGGNITDYDDSHYYVFRNIDTITLRDSRCNTINVSFCDTLTIDSTAYENYYNQIIGQKIRNVNIYSPDRPADNTYYANSNSFYVRDITNMSITGSAYQNNDNNFHDSAFENGTITFSNARNNYVTCRGENAAVTFDDTCYDNKVYTAQSYELISEMRNLRYFEHLHGCFKLPRVFQGMHAYPIYELNRQNIGNVINLYPYDANHIIYRSAHTDAEINTFDVPIKEEFALLFNASSHIRIEFKLYDMSDGSLVTTDLKSQLFCDDAALTFNAGTYSLSTAKNHQITTKFGASDRNKYVMRVTILTSTTITNYTYIKAAYLTFGFTGINPISSGNWADSIPTAAAGFVKGDYVRNVGAGANNGWIYDGSAWQAV